ncbi:MAG: hypothetical protein ABIO70_28540 [Pseudomonadota bacterium]
MRWVLAVSLLLALAGPVRAATVQEYRRYPLALEEGEEGRWSVTSPAGGPLDTMTLAQVWFDRPGAHRLIRQDRGAWWLAGVQAAVGLGLGIGAVMAFEEADHYLPKRSGYDVSRRDYRHREDYLYARQQADLAYAAAMAAVPEYRRMKAENMAWTGLTLAFSGALVVGLVPMHRLRFQRVEREPDLFYSRADAQRRVDLWNLSHPAEGLPPAPTSPPVAWPGRIPGSRAVARSVEAW